MDGRAKDGAASSFRLADHTGRLFDWWLGELSALVPNRWRARFTTRPAAIVCVLDRQGKVACARADRSHNLPDPTGVVPPGPELVARLSAMGAKARQRTLRLSVPRDLCLVRHTRLPARALAHAEAILDHEIEALMPVQSGHILSDWFVREEDPETGELHVMHVILSRARLAELEEAVREAGLRITHLTVDDGEGTPLPVDLVANREPSLRRAFARMAFPTKLVYAAAVALVLATPFLAVARQSQALERLEQTPRLSSAAKSALAVANAIEAGASRTTTLAVLDEMARRLPKDASLADFRRAGEDAEVTVVGPQMQAAREALSASPLFQGVEAADEAAPNAARFRFAIRPHPSAHAAGAAE